MVAIKHALTERFYAWEDAVKLAEDDPEVDLSGNGNPYTPLEYLEEEEVVEEPEGRVESRGNSEERVSTGGEGAKAADVEGTGVDPSALPSGQAQRDTPRA